MLLGLMIHACSANMKNILWQEDQKFKAHWFLVSKEGKCFGVLFSPFLNETDVKDVPLKASLVL